jgi:hypothetical protein
MKQLRHFMAVFLILICLAGATTTFAADFVIKYYIFSMATEQNRKTIVDFISGQEGVQKVETVLDRHWVYIYLEDEILEDERFDIRVPLRDMGHPVNRWEVLLEKPDSHD